MQNGLLKLSSRQTAIGGAAIALGGVVLAFLPWGAPTIRVTALLGCVLFAPGYALARQLPATRKLADVTRVALAFPFSCAMLVVPLFIAQLAGFGGGVVQVLYHPLLLLAAALLLLPESKQRRNRDSGGYPLPVLALTLLLIPVAMLKGGEIDLNADSLDHIAYIREVQSTGINFPTTAYFDPSSDMAYDIRKGYLQPVFARVATIAGADAVTLWRSLPALAMIFFSLSFYALARETLGGDGAHTIAWLLALLCFDTGIGGSWFYRAGTPFLFAGPCIWAFLLIVFHSSKTKRPQLSAALLTGIALVGCHLFAAVVAALLGAFHVLLSLLVHRQKAKWGAGLLTLAALCTGFLPIGIWRFVTSYPPLDPLHTHLQGIVWVGKGLYMSSPVAAVKRTAIIGISAIPFSLLLLRRAGREEGILFAIAITIVPLLIILNPLTAPLIVPILGYLIDRIGWYGGNYLILGVLITTWAAAFRTKRSLWKRSTAGASLAFAAILLATTLVAGDQQDRWKSLTFNRGGAPAAAPADWNDLFLYLRDYVAPRATIATDPATGYIIPAFTEQKTIAVRAQHSSPADPKAIQRLHDALRVMSPYVNSVETAAILNEYHAEYVLLNFRFDHPVTLEYGSVHPSLYEATLAKFRCNLPYYREVYSHDRVHLFRVVGNLAEVAAHVPVLRASVDEVPRGAREVGTLFPNHVRLVAASIRGPVTTASNEIEFDCYWRKEKETADPIPYRLYIRFDRVDEELDGGKLGRKLKQITKNKLYRARMSRNLVDGAYPPFAWRVGELVADSFRCPIPPKLEAGRYRIELLLRRKPHLQIHFLDDYLSERDSFSGVPVGLITVGKPGDGTPSATGPRDESW